MSSGRIGILWISTSIVETRGPRFNCGGNVTVCSNKLLSGSAPHAMLQVSTSATTGRVAALNGRSLQAVKTVGLQRKKHAVRVQTASLPAFGSVYKQPATVLHGPSILCLTGVVPLTYVHNCTVPLTYVHHCTVPLTYVHHCTVHLHNFMNAGNNYFTK
jgi:hypothetical protein